MWGVVLVGGGWFGLRWELLFHSISVELKDLPVRLKELELAELRPAALGRA